jgi:phage terminase large subunit-like protein
VKIDNAHGARKGHERQKAAREERRRLERETRNAESRLAPARLFAGALKTMLRALPHVARMHVLALIERRTERQLTFREWVDRVRPGYLWPPHLVALANVLQDVADGLVTRVMCFMPPRHGKSEAISRLFSAYYLYRHPGLEVALTTYGADLSYELSRDARDNFLASGGELTGDANAVKAWNTLQGGRLWATGVGGPATGRGVHLGIIDDPYKDHTEAGSSIVRKSRLGWYRSVFFTRRAPGAAIVILLTRWHQADMTAELLKEEERTKQRWTVLDFPAEKRTVRALAPRLDPITGQTLPAPPAFKWPSTVTIAPDVRDHLMWLWSARFSVEEYEETKRVQGGESGYFWNALFQQRPVSPEGGLFKREQIKRIARAQLPPMIGRIRRWDLAATASDGAFTAGLRVEKSVMQGYYITALEHGQWDAGPRDAVILRTARVDGPYIMQGVPVDPAAAGKQVARQFVAMLDGIAPVILMPETGDKLLRATHPSSAAGNGMLSIVDEPWAETVIAELCAAGDGAEYWDIVDALSGAFTYLGPLREQGGHSDSHSVRSTGR